MGGVAGRGIAGRLLLGAALAGLPVPAALAESGFPETENPIVFLEKSYLSPLFLAPSDEQLILEGQASGHYFIHNGLKDAVWRRDGGTRFAFPISMIFVVRIFDEDSAPVRTPSFILRPVYGQFFHLSRKPGKATLFGFGTGITHHSNGQSGCTFLDESPHPTEDRCVLTGGTSGERRPANLVDGSFSTNFIPIHASVEWSRLDGNADVSRSIGVRFTGEIHPKQFLKGGMSRSLAREYGQLMMGGGVELEKAMYGGVGRVDLAFQSRFGADKDGTDSAGRLEVSFVFGRAEHMGVFGRWHVGSDYYNIRFQDERPWLQFGLIWDPGRIKFERKRASSRRRTPGG